MFYLKLAGILLWAIAVTAAGLLTLPFRRGDPGFLAWFVRLLSRGGLRVAGIRIEVENRERVTATQPCVYLANHQSAMDLLTYGVMAPSHTTIIAKAELRRVPGLGALLAGAGVRFIDRRNPEQAIPELKRLADAMRAERISVAVAPEGTRNRDAGQRLLPFKHGPFHLAIQAGVPCLPVVCEPIGHLVSWSGRRLRSGTIRFKVLDPIETTGLTEAEAGRLAALARDRMQRAIDSFAGR